MPVFRPDEGQGFIMSVTTASARSTAGQLNVNQSSMYIYNEGPNAACVRWGKGNLVATANDLCIGPNSAQTFGKDGADVIAAICESGTARLHIIGGIGE